MTNLRVLHCPDMVAGNPYGLARAEREIGLDSLSVAFYQNRFNFLSDKVLFSAKDNTFTREIKRWHLLWQAVRDFDIIHFNFGQSIMPQRVLNAGIPISKLKKIYQIYAGLFEFKDLIWLKKAGKGIVITYQGDDCRQGDFCQANFEINVADEVPAGYYSLASDALKRERIAEVAKYADCIFALNPDLLHVLPAKAKFLPYSHIDLRDWQFLDNSIVNSKKPLVVHAPSHRGAKGTRFILEAVKQLQAENINFEFILVEGLPHNEARKIYEKADLLIDQLLAGWYGGLAVELMALGKPVICYLRESDLKFIPEQMRKDLPLINATPKTIYDVLKQWLTVEKYQIIDRGKRSRAYVEKWHDPLKIAVKTKQEYDNILASKYKT